MNDPMTAATKTVAVARDLLNIQMANWQAESLIGLITGIVLADRLEGAPARPEGAPVDRSDVMLADQPGPLPEDWPYSPTPLLHDATPARTDV